MSKKLQFFLIQSNKENSILLQIVWNIEEIDFKLLAAKLSAVKLFAAKLPRTDLKWHSARNCIGLSLIGMEHVLMWLKAGSGEGVNNGPVIAFNDSYIPLMIFPNTGLFKYEFVNKKIMIYAQSTVSHLMQKCASGTIPPWAIPPPRKFLPNPLDTITPYRFSGYCKLTILQTHIGLFCLISRKKDFLWKILVNFFTSRFCRRTLC